MWPRVAERVSQFSKLCGLYPEQEPRVSQLYGFAMLETIRRYWIGLLVIVLVGLHAGIVGMIRHQASLAKVDASCEVDLGEYLAFQSGKKSPLQMRLHAVVPINHRMKSRQVIELNKAQIRQSLEEYLRQIDSKVLIDPYLADLKSQLMEVLVQTIGDSSIDDLVITEVRESNANVSLEFVSKGSPQTPRRLVATLRDPSKEEKPDEAVTEEDQEHLDGQEHSEAHAEPVAKAHAPAKPGAHGAAAKKSSGHAVPAKKPAAGGHGAPAASGHGAPAAGHGAAAKKPAKDAKKSGGH